MRPPFALCFIGTLYHFLSCLSRTCAHILDKNVPVRYN
nr:MAG TPA: hypothetical protein [Caudoviricetes sp.]